MSEQLELFGRYSSLTFRESKSLYWELEGRFLPGRSHIYDLKRLEEFFRETYLHVITPFDIQNYRRWRKLENPELRDSSINREHTRLTRLINAFKAWKRQGNIGPYDFSALELPNENPGEAVKKVDERKYKRNRIVTPEEFSKFCDYAHPEVRKICVIAILTLLRRKDIRLLSAENLNRTLDSITGVQSKTGLPYNVPATVTVKVYFAKAEHKYICDFTNWRRRFTRAKIESSVFFLLQDLRRSGATQLLFEGIDIRTIQKLLGHADIAMTEIYLDPPAPVAKSAGRKLESAYVTKNNFPAHLPCEN